MSEPLTRPVYISELVKNYIRAAIAGLELPHWNIDRHDVKNNLRLALGEILILEGKNSEITDGIPPEIIEAARRVELWMKQNGHAHWKLMGIQSRES